MEILPHFKGYEDKLTSYLINELDIEKITTSLSESTRLVSDTIHVKFIISKAAVMSNLDIQSSNLTLTSEFKRMFIKSACNWIPGYSNRNLNGWYSSLIYFTLDRSGKFLSISVKIQ